MRSYLTLGPTPYDEDCVQVSDGNYLQKMRAEATRYKDLMVKRFPFVVENTWFATKSFGHDFGTYVECVVGYCDEDPESYYFAVFAEHNTPASWDDDKVFTMEDFVKWKEYNVS